MNLEIELALLQAEIDASVEAASELARAELSAMVRSARKSIAQKSRRALEAVKREKHDQR